MLDGGGPGVRLGRLLRLPFPRLDAVLPHRQGPVHAVQLEVEAASVANGLALVVAPPKGGGAGAAVGAAQPQPPGRGLKFKIIIYSEGTEPAQKSATYQTLRRLYQGPVHPVHLVVESARVAQIMSGPVPPPERRRYRAAINALPAFAELKIHRGV